MRLTLLGKGVLPLVFYLFLRILADALKRMEWDGLNNQNYQRRDLRMLKTHTLVIADISHQSDIGEVGET